LPGYLIFRFELIVHKKVGALRRTSERGV
jgi:hypothetical protein